MKVSVVMITYMHEAFIAEAINGVLMQKCDFDVELIIADDCSPDKTKSVVESFKDYPNYKWINYTRHDVNKGMMVNFMWALEQASGKYIALCEGDDYWTDSMKLQEQLGFLESNPDYSFICGNTQSFTQDTGELKLLKPGENKIITKENFCYPYLISTCTVLFHSKIIETIPLKRFKFFKDITLYSLLLKSGNGYYDPHLVGVYRIHEGGIWSMNNNRENEIANLNSFLEIYYFVFKTNQIEKYLINIEIKPNQIWQLIAKNRLILLWCGDKTKRRIKLLINRQKLFIVEWITNKL